MTRGAELGLPGQYSVGVVAPPTTDKELQNASSLDSPVSLSAVPRPQAH